MEHLGVVGVDLNADHLAVTDVDRFGNPIAAFRVPCPTRGKRHHQVRAIIGDAVGQVVTYACLQQKPIIVERLQFDDKKAALEQRGARCARMLSGFAYAALHAIIAARCDDAGIASGASTPRSRRDRRAHRRRALRSLPAPRRRLCHWAAGYAARRAASPPTGRPRHLSPTRAESGEAVWAFWRQVARRERRFERTDGRAPPGPDPRRHRLRDLDGARLSVGSIAPAGRLLHLPVELRHANRQQHCSAGVWEQVPYVRRIRNGGAPLPDVVMSRHRRARRVSTRVARVSPAISEIVR